MSTQQATSHFRSAAVAASAGVAGVGAADGGVTDGGGTGDGARDFRARWLVPLSFAAVYLIWGSTYLGIAVAIASVPPFLMAGARFLIAGVLLYGVLRLSGVPAPDRQQWLSSLVLGLLMIFGGNGFVTYAELSVPSGVAALFIATVPLWMIVLERGLFAGPPPGRATWLGLSFGLTGVLLLVGPARLSVRHDQTLGSVLLLLAAVSWAYGSLASRRLALPSSPLMVSALQMICGSGFMLVASVVLGEWRAFEPSQVSGRSLLAMAYLVLFGSVIGYSAYLYLLRRVSAAAVGTYAFVNPAVAVTLGWLLAGESLDARTAAAMLCILGGVASILVSRARRRRRIVVPGSATA